MFIFCPLSFLKDERQKGLTLGTFLPICPGKGDGRQQQSHQPAAQQSITEREAATAASLSCKQEHGLLKQLRGTERLEEKPWLRMNGEEGRSGSLVKRPELNLYFHIWIRVRVHNIASWGKGCLVADF